MEWWFCVKFCNDCLYVILVGSGDFSELYGVVYVSN